MNSSSGEAFPHRHSMRLRDYDYTWQGAYFIIICTHNRQSLFGKIIDSSVKLNQFGEIVESCWNDIPLHYPSAESAISVVMPNHVHAILVIEGLRRAGSKPAPTSKHPLSEIVRGFKTYSSRKINRQRNSYGIPVWQRGYYEHVIRHEAEYNQIGDYILFNAAKWDTDLENQNSSLNNLPLPFEY